MEQIVLSAVDKFIQSRGFAFSAFSFFPKSIFAMSLGKFLWGRSFPSYQSDVKLRLFFEFPSAINFLKNIIFFIRILYENFMSLSSRRNLFVNTERVCTKNSENWHSCKNFSEYKIFRISHYSHVGTVRRCAALLFMQT